MKAQEMANQAFLNQMLSSKIALSGGQQTLNVHTMNCLPEMSATTRLGFQESQTMMMTRAIRTTSLSSGRFTTISNVSGGGGFTSFMSGPATVSSRLGGLLAVNTTMLPNTTSYNSLMSPQMVATQYSTLRPAMMPHTTYSNTMRMMASGPTTLSASPNLFNDENRGGL